jgi:hypothetical protein
MRSIAAFRQLGEADGSIEYHIEVIQMQQRSGEVGSVASVRLNQDGGQIGGNPQILCPAVVIRHRA